MVIHQQYGHYPLTLKVIGWSHAGLFDSSFINVSLLLGFYPRVVTNVIHLLFNDDQTIKIWDTSADLSQPKTGEGHESW